MRGQGEVRFRGRVRVRVKVRVRVRIIHAMVQARGGASAERGACAAPLLRLEWEAPKSAAHRS